MVDPVLLQNIILLCAEIFHENDNVSNKINIFAAGNPNPLRIYVEDYLNKLYKSKENGLINEEILHKVIELDFIITEYIEERWQ